MGETHTLPLSYQLCRSHHHFIKESAIALRPLIIRREALDDVGKVGGDRMMDHLPSNKKKKKKKKKKKSGKY